MSAQVTSIDGLRGRVAAKHATQRAEALLAELQQFEREGLPEAHSEALLDLLGMMRGTMPERAAAVEVLGDVVASAFGDDGARVGRIVRESGAIDDLRDLLTHESTREPALLVLGNLVSDSVDPGSAATKIALLQSEGAASALIRCLDECRDASELAFAVGCLQNLCHDREWSGLLIQRGVHATLEALLSHSDELVVRYASGALKNMTVTMQDAALFSGHAARAVSERSFEADVEEFRYRRAASVIVRAIGRMPPDVRLRRLLAAKEKGTPERGSKPDGAAARLANAAERSHAAAAARHRGGGGGGCGCGGSRTHTPGASVAGSSAGGRHPHQHAGAGGGGGSGPGSAAGSSSSSVRAAAAVHQPAAPAAPAAAASSTPPINRISATGALAPTAGSKPGSDASSSHSGSTAYYSIASSAQSKAGKEPPQPSACFEV